MMKRQKGFTLMEAIVALVLMATTGMALFSWVNGNIISLQRVQASNAQNAVTANALQYMHTINPMATPDGTTTLGTNKLHWKSVLLNEIRDGASYPTGISLYQLAMYQVQVDLQTEDGKDWFSFKFQQVGYKKVREIPKPF